MANSGYKGGDIAHFREFLIKNLVVVESAAGDRAELLRLNDAAHDGSWLINSQSFTSALIAASQLLDWLIERVAEESPAARTDVLRELALASAQMTEGERDNPSGGE